MTTAGAETAAGAIALAGVGVCTASLVVLHLLPTGLSPLRNAVSQYGITPYRLGYRIQTVSMGISAIGVAVGVEELDIQGCTLVVALFALVGATRLVIGWFPMDDPDAERTQTGRRHGLLAIVAFTGIAIGAIRLGEILGTSGRWPGSATAISVLGYALLAILIVMGSVRRSRTGRGYFGLVERGFYAAAIALLVVAGVALVNAH